MGHVAGAKTKIKPEIADDKLGCKQIERVWVMEKQKLRIIHNMARSGSTIICRCLGCMEGVVLLSELHPLAWKLFNPIDQAQDWFGLFAPGDIGEMKKLKDVSYTQVITLIEQRCRERGETLVLRDWAHLDYTGFPFMDTPEYRPMLYTELVGSFDIVRISITRDPVAQWQSLIQLEVMQDSLNSGAFGIDQFLAGYRKFADLCIETGFIRYEDFLHNPDSELRKLCEHLQIEFDPDFANKWFDYNTITGYVPDPERLPHHSSKIQPPSSKPVEPDLKNKFLANSDYRSACELLGYGLLEK